MSSNAAHTQFTPPGLAQLCGIDSAHVAQVTLAARQEVTIHPQIAASLHALRAAAAEAGFDLCVASAYRDYWRQLGIWNAKVSGELSVFSADEQLLDVATLNREELLFAILYWSAIPGCSRHHWGTDIDVYDAAAVEADYRVQLTHRECAKDGPFEAFHKWLDERLATDNAFGFFRPYVSSLRGVAPEPWHLSWAPLSRLCQASLSAGQLRSAASHGLPALDIEIGRHFDTIFRYYIQVPLDRYPQAFRDLPQNNRIR